MRECPHCREGAPLIKLKRQWIHRIDYRNVVCTEAGVQVSPRDWKDVRPWVWAPRRIRKQERGSS